MGELLWYYCSPVCGSPTRWVWDLILSWLCPSSHLTAASSLSLHKGYLFLVACSALLTMMVQQLVSILVLSQEEVYARPSPAPSWNRKLSIFYLPNYCLLKVEPGGRLSFLALVLDKSASMSEVGCLALWIGVVWRRIRQGSLSLNSLCYKKALLYLMTWACVFIPCEGFLQQGRDCMHWTEEGWGQVVT